MTNPFSELKNALDAHQKRLEQEKESKILDEEAIKQSKNNATLEYGEIIKNVLTQLRDTAYPSFSVSQVATESSWGIATKTAWEISSFISGSSSEYVGGFEIPTGGYTSVKVSVSLEFDPKGKPTNFTCKHDEKVVKAKLTQDDLTRVLIKLLHP